MTIHVESSNSVNIRLIIRHTTLAISYSWLSVMKFISIIEEIMITYDLYMTSYTVSRTSCGLGRVSLGRAALGLWEKWRNLT